MFVLIYYLHDVFVTCHHTSMGRNILRLEPEVGNPQLSFVDTNQLQRLRF